MEHSFNIDIAEKYGTNEAVLLNNLYFWIERNKKNNKNYNDGMYWTYNSVKAFNEIFKYMKPYSIRKALKNLEEKGLIVIGNYNQVAYDRTSWYSITEKGLSELGISICDIRNFHLSKTENGFIENRKPIPDIKPNIKPDVKPDKKEEASLPTYPPHTYELSKLIFKHSNVEPNKTQLNAGAKVIDELARLDHYKPDEIRSVIDWAIKDDFWGDNILSPASLRKKKKRIG